MDAGVRAGQLAGSRAAALERGRRSGQSVEPGHREAREGGGFGWRGGVGEVVYEDVCYGRFFVMGGD